MAQLFKCKTVKQKKIEQWLADQGITVGDIAAVRLSGPAMVRITNPAGQYMDLYCDQNNNVRILNISQEREEELVWRWSEETEDPETQEWRWDLTADEDAMVEQWEKQYAIGIRNLLERQQTVAEPETTPLHNWEPEM